jgi:O-antigen/teichoic acid export membrane protein
MNRYYLRVRALRRRPRTPLPTPYAALPTARAAASPTSLVSSPSTVRILPLRVNFTWTLVGNVVYAGCQWAMLMVLAKLGSPEKVGQFALGLAVTAPVIMLSNLQLRAVQATDAEGSYSFGHYLALRLVTTLLALASIGIIVACTRYGRDTSLVVLAVAGAKAVEAISDVLYGLWQQHERLDRIAKSMLIKGPLSLGVVTLNLHMTGSVLAAALGLVIAWAMVLLAYDIPSAIAILRCTMRQRDDSVTAPYRSLLRPRWERRSLLRLAALALPLGVTMLLLSLTTNIPRYFIERVLGVRALGIFAALAYSLTAGTTVVAALGQSASPRLAKYYAAGNRGAFQALLLKLLLAGASLGVAGLLVAFVGGRQLLNVAYTAEYAEHAGLLLLLMGAAAIGYVASFLGYAATAARQFRPQLPLSIAAATTTVLACAWLVPRFGLPGAAWALLITSAVQTAGAAIVLSRALRETRGVAVG